MKRETLKIVLDENGNKIVILPDIIFSNKQNIDWNELESSIRLWYNIGRYCTINTGWKEQVCKTIVMKV